MASLLLFSVAVTVGCSTENKRSETPWPEGIYGNVKYSDLSGDLGGFEIRFYKDGDRRMAEFVMCEGWCNKSYHSEVQSEAGSFAVSHVETLKQQPGSNADHQVRYLMTPIKDALKLRMWYDNYEIPLGESASLLPAIEETYGLAVINDADGS